MSRQKMITVAADDVHTMVVGTLSGFQHKRKMANDPDYVEEVRQVEHTPTTFQMLFGLPAKVAMRTALGV